MRHSLITATAAAAAVLVILAPPSACASSGNGIQICIQTLDRANYNAPTICSDGDAEIPENSLVTFWSFTQNRTGGRDSWDSLLPGWATDEFSKGRLGLSIFADVWNTSSAADNGRVGGTLCSVENEFAHARITDCAATSVFRAPDYDGPPAFQQFLDAHPAATSVPWGGVVFLSPAQASDKALIIPAGYLKVVSPRPTPYRAAYMSQLMYISSSRMTIVAADEKRANLDPANATPLDFLAGHPATSEAGHPATSEAGSLINGRALALALAVLSLLLQ
ncbi:hypothetical protein HDU88_002168 [Geranomyces variabilis]|nr:hypothetical protein HDU88_002168 [Geranomyces variabilis]